MKQDSVTEMASHRFWCISFVRSKSLGQSHIGGDGITQNCESQGQGSLGSVSDAAYHKCFNKTHSILLMLKIMRTSCQLTILAVLIFSHLLQFLLKDLKSFMHLGIYKYKEKVNKILNVVISGGKILRYFLQMLLFQFCNEHVLHPI